MKKIFKVILWIVGIIVGLPVLMILGLYIYAKFTNPVKVDPSGYHWKTGMSEAEIEKAALDLIGQMTVEDKVDQLTGRKGNLTRLMLIRMFEKKLGHVYAGANKRLDIPPISFSDGSRGITTARGTCFPCGMARAATWDTDLERQVGDIMGREARSAGANYYGGLCINLLRHPSWGRAQETFGEDPWLTGEMALATMQGIQYNNVMDCAKHYALNSIENSRNFVNVKADERILHEVYLPHLKKCADNGLASIMSAYNKVNGEYCGHNHTLLTTIPRDEWGWKGFISSDFVAGIYDGEKAANAGMDVEMPVPEDYGEKLIALIESGKMARILFGETNPSGKLPFTVAMRQEDYPYFNNTDSVIDYGYYHGYKLFDKKGIKPAYHFGYGLSYTTFCFDSLRILTPEITAADTLKISVMVENTGQVAGKEVVQVYIGFGNSQLDRPMKLLRGFKKIRLEPGGKETVCFQIPAIDLAYYHPGSKSWQVEEMTCQVYAGSSSAAADLLEGEFKVKQ